MNIQSEVQALLNDIDKQNISTVSGLNSLGKAIFAASLNTKKILYITALF